MQESLDRTGIQVGDRVELSPALDFWMRGARYGEVLSVKKGVAKVQLDKISRPQRFYLADLTIV